MFLVEILDFHPNAGHNKEEPLVQEICMKRENRENRECRVLLVACALLFGAGLLGCIGCQSAQALDFEQKMALIDKAHQMAKEDGISYYATLTINGDPNVYEKAGFGFDTGVEAVIHFQGNAQDAASEVDPVGPPLDLNSVLDDVE